MAPARRLVKFALLINIAHCGVLVQEKASFNDKGLRMQLPAWLQSKNGFSVPKRSSENCSSTSQAGVQKPWLHFSYILPFKHSKQSNCSDNKKIFPFKTGNVSSALDSINKLFLPVQTVDKFPPVIEFFVQKIQASQSNYVYEDLSRPPTYDKPVYTLSPEDEAFFNLTPSSTTESVDINQFDYEEVVDTTEKLFEIIANNSPSTVRSTDDDAPAIVEDKEGGSTPKSEVTSKIPNLIEKKEEDVAYSHLGVPNVVYIRKSDVALGEKRVIRGEDGKFTDLQDSSKSQ